MSIAGAMSRSSLLLGGFAALTAALIAWTFLLTREDIARAEREAEAKQLLQLFPAATHDNSLIDDRFTVPKNTPLLELRSDRYGYVAKMGGETVGVILPATARDGYSGDIRLLVGITSDGSVAGVRVVTHRETPGLGDAIDLNKSNWILGFDGYSLDNPQADGWAVKKDGGIFDQFTGATVTPRAVVEATRKALEYAETHQTTLFPELDATYSEATL